MKTPKHREYRSKDLDATYRSWAIRRLVQAFFLAAVIFAALRFMGAMGVDWAKKYDLIGKYVTRAYVQDTGMDSDSPGE